MIKLIASDMDGTLLNDYWRISDENAQAIKRAQEHGIEFMVATGRPYENAYVITDTIDLKCAIVGLNGATTHDADGQLIAMEVLTPDEVKTTMNILDQHHIYYELNTNKGAFSTSYNKLTEILYTLASLEYPHLSEDERRIRVEALNEERIRNENCQFVDDFESILQDDTVTIYKIFSMSLNQEALDKADAQLRALKQFYVTSSGHMNLEVTAINGHKGYAVFNYAASRGIKPEEVMTMGDNFNDLTMLLNAGRGVAMGTAHENIKKQVRYTTKTHLEHGVAHAIHQMLDEQLSYK